MKKNEFNSPPREYKSGGKEYTFAEEIKSFSATASSEEMPSGGSEYPSGGTAAKRERDEDKKDRHSSENAARTASNVVNGFVAVAAVAVVGVVSVSASADISAEFVSLEATESAISYTVEVEGDTDTELVVYNDFTRRTVTLSNGENVGEVTGLVSDMKYTVAVVYDGTFGEKTVIETSIRTDKYAAPVTELYSVEHVCTCNVDGYFHFTLDFSDENGYWSEFAASLTDGYGNVSYCEFTGDAYEEQVIDVALSAGLLGNSAEFTVTCRTSDPEAESEELVLYTTTVTI